MEEWIEKIKDLPNPVKWLLVIILSVGWNLYGLIDEVPKLEEELHQVQQEKELARKKYLKAKSDAEKLIKLEVTLKTIREQLQKATRHQL